jgi:hypothetical protein
MHAGRACARKMAPLELHLVRPGSASRAPSHAVLALRDAAWRRGPTAHRTCSAVDVVTSRARLAVRVRGLLVSALLVACAYGVLDTLPPPDDVEVTDAAAAPGPSETAAPAPGTGAPCDRPNKRVTILIDGSPTEVEIYVACDPGPYRELGDPPP